MKTTKGFTIIELLVVIAVIGILAGISYLGYSGIRKSVERSARRAEISQIKKAMQAALERNRMDYFYSRPYVTKGGVTCPQYHSWFVHEGYQTTYCYLGEFLVEQNVLPRGFINSKFNGGYDLFLMTCNGVTPIRTYLIYSIDQPTPEESSLYATARACRMDLGEPQAYGRNAAVLVK
ncbi:hypothetical protein B7Z28_01840 [Candidatus Saccharibacteria bacterium 32-45-3]|nr:MAG: hypothetical protein B7Z28_01840 [Candidatus Saccharibacteria bacterium 32-45-3]